jgi:hypothetical protein
MKGSSAICSASLLSNKVEWALKFMSECLGYSRETAC